MKVLSILILLMLFNSSAYADTSLVEGGNAAKQPSLFEIKKTDNNRFSEKKIEGFGQFKKEIKAKKPYTNIKITSPLSGQILRNNITNIPIKLDVIPRLQLFRGHKIKIEYDGTMRKQSWKSTSILLSHVGQGKHSLKAYIVDSSGNTIKSSATVTFELRRFSRRFN